MTDEERTLMQAAQRLVYEMAKRDLLLREALNTQLADFAALRGILRQLAPEVDEGKDAPDA